MKDLETAKELNYFFFLNHFGLTPEQVDKIPYDKVMRFKDLKNIEIQGQIKFADELKKPKGK